jgi:hypothetical protein
MESVSEKSMKKSVVPRFETCSGIPELFWKKSSFRNKLTCSGNGGNVPDQMNSIFYSATGGVYDKAAPTVSLPVHVSHHVQFVLCFVRVMCFSYEKSDLSFLHEDNHILHRIHLRGASTFQSNSIEAQNPSLCFEFRIPEISADFEGQRPLLKI